MSCAVKAWAMNSTSGQVFFSITFSCESVFILLVTWLCPWKIFVWSYIQRLLDRLTWHWAAFKILSGWKSLAWHLQSSSQFIFVIVQKFSLQLNKCKSNVITPSVSAVCCIESYRHIHTQEMWGVCMSQDKRDSCSLTANVLTSLFLNISVLSSTLTQQLRLS